MDLTKCLPETDNHDFKVSRIMGSNAIFGLRYLTLINDKDERYICVMYDTHVIGHSDFPVRVTHARKEIESFIKEYNQTLLLSLRKQDAPGLAQLKEKLHKAFANARAYAHK